MTRTLILAAVALSTVSTMACRRTVPTEVLIEARPPERRHVLARRDERERLRPLERVITKAAPIEQARDEDDDLTTVARERRQFRRILAREVMWLDRRTAELEREGSEADVTDEEQREVDIAAARAWRTRLKQDLDALERSAGRTWPALRQKIEHDLDSPRPASLPRAYDSACAI
jgi:hypothetical protein